MAKNIAMPWHMFTMVEYHGCFPTKRAALQHAFYNSDEPRKRPPVQRLGRGYYLYYGGHSYVQGYIITNRPEIIEHEGLTHLLPEGQSNG